MWTATRVIALLFTVVEVLLLIRFAFNYYSYYGYHYSEKPPESTASS